MERYVGSFFTKSNASKRPRIEASTDESSHDKQDECATSSIQNNSVVDTNIYVADPGKRLPIIRIAKSDKERETIRRAYLMNGPCQPVLDAFPQTLVGNKLRRFNSKWYNDFGTWLEYSVSKDAVFCLHCYLFSCEYGDGRVGRESFVEKGFRNWKDKQRLIKHIGKDGSIHSLCSKAAVDLINQGQHTDIVMSDISDTTKQDYLICLNDSIDCIRYLFGQEFPFCGHDEIDGLINKGNFLELVRLICRSNEGISKVSSESAPEDLTLTSPKIRKDVINVAACLTTMAIISDIGDSFFSLMIDKACDVSTEEQMTIVLRYVNCEGHIIERLIGIVHVSDTAPSALKEAIELFFVRHGLSLSKIRGQGYNGASNMSHQFSGLKSLILSENSSAYYIHCSAHQLQLALVACAKKVEALPEFFNCVSLLCNVLGASCDIADVLTEKQFEPIVKSIASGDVQTSRGLNQDMSLSRSGDTCWSSYYLSLVSINNLFDPILDVLEIVEVQKFEASGLMKRMQTFEFVLLLNIMINVLAITNELSLALQRKDQDIVNAMVLVKVSKVLLQELRDNGWDDLFKKTCDFCTKHDIGFPNLEGVLALQGREKRRGRITNLHHFKIDIFYGVIDTQLQELNDRFSDVTLSLLECMACLDPRNSFLAFDKNKLGKVAGFYPLDFDMDDLVMLEHQFDTYIVDVRSDPDFSTLRGISELAKKMVEKRKDVVYPLVYLLIKLALTLPVATAFVERAFSAVSYVKAALCDRIGDDFLRDCLVPYIENDVFNGIDNEAIVTESLKTKP